MSEEQVVSTEGTVEKNEDEQLQDELSQLESQLEEASAKQDTPEDQQVQPPMAEEEADPPQEETPAEPEVDEPAQAEDAPPEDGEEKPKAKDYAEFRIKYTEMERKNQELAERLDQVQKAQEQAQAAPETHANASDPNSAASVIATMLRAKLGDLNDVEIAKLGSSENALSLCHQALANEVEPEALKGVLAQAATGRFGEQSDEVANIAARYLTIAQTRELEKFQSEQAAQKEALKKQQELASQKQEEIQKVVQDFPEFAKKDSDANAYINKWNKENIGTVDAQGRALGDGNLPQAVAQRLLDHPYENVKMIAAQFNNSGSSAQLQQKVQTLEAELTKLRKEQGLSDALPSGGPAVAPDNKGTTADDIERMIAERSASIGR